MFIGGLTSLKHSKFSLSHSLFLRSYKIGLMTDWETNDVAISIAFSVPLCQRSSNPSYQTKFDDSWYNALSKVTTQSKHVQVALSAE